MLKEKLQNALNAQIQHELTAAHNYLAMSVWFDRQQLPGLARYMEKQAGEERSHAMRLIRYVQDAGGEVVLTGIDAPRTKFGGLLEVCQHARALERANTAAIHRIYDLAAGEGDLATQQAMLWFIEEQVEEEKWCEDFVAMAEKVENHVGAIFMFDHRVAKLAEKD